MHWLLDRGPLPRACCTGVSKLNSIARTTPDRQQACRCLKTAASALGSGLNAGRAAGLPKACGVNVPFPISLLTPVHQLQQGHNCTKEEAREFIGTPTHQKEQLQEEFFSAKCCSLRKKDLAKHFERQTRRYYALNGLNNPSLKHVYLSSIDDYLSQQTKLYIKDQGQTIEEVSIRQIQQYVFRTLDKLCKQKEYWTEFMDRSKQLSKICSRPDLSIKFRRMRFFRKKRSFKKSTKCFLCRKEGHFAKNYPNKSAKKKQYLINSISEIAPDIDLEGHDLESVLSYDSDDNDAICGYSEYDNSSESSLDEIQTPHLPVTIFDPSCQEDPVHAIAFIDEQSFHGPAKEKNPKPSSFEKDGTVIYPFKDKDGHCYFDVCSCTACDEASYESDEDIRIRRRKKKDPLYQRYLEGVTSVGPPGEGKYDFIVQYSDKKEEPRQLIMMINPDEFPPQEEFLRNNIAHCPKILSQAVDSSGPSQLSQAEKVLNWQTENSLAQNQLLSTINHKVDQLAEGYNSRLLSLQNSIAEIHGRLGNLHQEMMTVAKHMMANTTQFRNKETETTSLKSQLRDLQSTSSGMPMYQGSYSPGFLFGHQTQKTTSPFPSFLSSDEIFTSRYGSTSSNYHPKTTRSKPRRQKESEFQVNPNKKPTVTSSSSHDSIKDSKMKGKDIGVIEFSMTSLLDNLSKLPESPDQKDQQPLSSQQPSSS
ncbi:unnamed protein product [Brassica napus]|uniref:Non-specific lipid-transfer protein n=1 Tax=Brassica napus TaxID=3708 RepID=A0A816JF04_BRANA|nr:unnamed protein product [Brassica napus]